MENAQVILGIISAVFAVLFGYSAYLNTRLRKENSQGKNDGVMLTEIGYIKAGIDEIKKKQDLRDDQVRVLYERMATVESTASQAHHRIDVLESKLK